VDISARFVGKQLTETLGQPVIVDNRPGAAGNIGANYVAKATPDGYTLLMAQSTIAMPSLFVKLPFDVNRDFDPVGLVALGPTVLLVHPSLRVNSVKELIALAKSKVKPLAYGSGGIGNITHLEMELLATMAGIEMTHLPYKGSAPGMIALIGGEIQLLFSSIPSALAQIRSDKVKALAVSTIKRSSALPDIPTLDEAGLPGYDAATWYGVFAPAGTVKNALRLLGREIPRIVRDPEIISRLQNDGFEPVGSGPEEFSRFLRDEIGKWAKVIKTAGIAPE
jgi:tripartite-type tricarboxylate transporter receptor subunit TctC